MGDFTDHPVLSARMEIADIPLPPVLEARREEAEVLSRIGVDLRVP
jgi:hypothetical protein